MQKRYKNLEEEVKESDIRLERLKQGVIEKYLTEIDFDNGIFEILINKLVEGELDNWFYAPELNDLEGEKRQNVFALAHAHSGLCFYQGDVNQWLESVEGGSLEDMGYTCMKILDNYNFLLNLANQGGLEALKEVERFDTSKYLNGPEIYSTDVPSVIEKLRNNFADDQLLLSIILKMTKDSEYKDLSIDEKVILCSYPEGNLYCFSDDDEISFIKPETIKKSLAINSLIEKKTQEAIKEELAAKQEGKEVEEKEEITLADLSEEEIKAEEENIDSNLFEEYVVSRYYDYITSNGYRRETATDFYR